MFFATLVLFLFGGPALEDFAFVLIVGVITGTYSTIYIAGSLIVDWTAWRESTRAAPRREPRPLLTAVPAGRARSPEERDHAG
jgi:preprotein translocase subunit SecF